MKNKLSDFELWQSLEERFLVTPIHRIQGKTAPKQHFWRNFLETLNLNATAVVVMVTYVTYTIHWGYIRRASSWTDISLKTSIRQLVKVFIRQSFGPPFWQPHGPTGFPHGTQYGRTGFGIPYHSLTFIKGNKKSFKTFWQPYLTLYLCGQRCSW